MIEIVHLEPADLPAAAAVIEAAFGRPGAGESLRRGYELQPQGYFCARRDGEIVGTVGAQRYQAPGSASAVASIGVMTVHPAVQRQGVGTRLMRHVLGYLATAGYPTAFLEASAAGAPLYRKLGFVACGETLRMARDGSTPAAPAPHGTVRPMLDADLPAVSGYDAQVFGAVRPAVIRAALERAQGPAFIVRDGTPRPAGYLFVVGGLLGPWSAGSPSIAEELLRTALDCCQGVGLRVTFPADNTAGRTLLARYGFCEIENLQHMRLGPAADARRRQEYYGQASLTLG